MCVFPVVNEEGTTPYEADHKVVNRIIALLMQEDLLRVSNVKVPMLSGIVKNYTLLLHHTLSPDHEMVRAFADKLKEKEVTIRPSPAKPDVELRQLYSTVERIGLTAQADTSEERDEADKPTAKKIARHYGFVQPKMLRVKLLHHFLWRCVYPTDTLPDPLPADYGHFLMSEILRRYASTFWFKTTSYSFLKQTAYQSNCTCK